MPPLLGSLSRLLDSELLGLLHHKPTICWLVVGNGPVNGIRGYTWAYVNAEVEIRDHLSEIFSSRCSAAFAVGFSHPTGAMFRMRASAVKAI